MLAVEVDSEVSALQVQPWNGPFRDLQWGLDRLFAEEADARLGARSAVTVAVIDAGVQFDVTDLSGLVL